MYNGFQKTLPDASVVCIHDSARPLVSQQAVLQVGTTINLVHTSLIIVHEASLCVDLTVRLYSPCR